MEKVEIWWGYLIIHMLVSVILFFPIRQTESYIMGKEIWITEYFKINYTVTRECWSKNFRRVSLFQTYRGIISRQTFFNCNRRAKKKKQKGKKVHALNTIKKSSALYYVTQLLAYVWGGGCGV